MKMRTYKAPQVALVLSDMEIMQTLPAGGSGYTDSGDDGGGGLAKDYDFEFEEEENWDEEDPWK